MAFVPVPIFAANNIIPCGVCCNYTMTKVDWLADGVFLLPSSIGFVNCQKKKWRGICNISTQWEARA
jgi:hypothetical protein